MVDEKKPKDTIEPDQKTKDNESDSSRRTILKSLAASSAAVAGQEVLPEDWKKPLIDTVVLPTHAQATTDDDNDGGSDTSSDDASDSQVFDDDDGTSANDEN